MRRCGRGCIRAALRCSSEHLLDKATGHKTSGGDALSYAAGAAINHGAFAVPSKVLNTVAYRPIVRGPFLSPKSVTRSVQNVRNLVNHYVRGNRRMF